MGNIVLRRKIKRVPYIFPEDICPISPQLEGIVRFITPAERIALEYNGHLKY